MNWNYAYTPTIWPSVITILLLVSLSIYSSRRRSVPGALPFSIGCMIAAARAVATILEYTSVDPATKIFWFKAGAVIQVPIVIAVTCFILEYAWPGRWLTRRNLALLTFPYLLSLVMILTDDFHHLAWRSFTVHGSVQPHFGPGNWLLLAYSFGALGVVNLVVFGWLFLHSLQHRWAVILMLVGQLVGRTLFTLDRLQAFQFTLSPAMLGISFEFLMYAIALFGFRILDPIPLARRTAIEQLHSGMLVLDTQGKIVSLNPAAAAILGSPAKRLMGRSIQEMLPSGFELAEDLQDTVEAEISLEDGLEIRSYQLEASALNDWRGLAVGRLLLLHDVTDQKRAQAQLVEQQRALAMLHEREMLARELHDSIGQVLGYVSIQAQAIRKRAQSGDLQAVETQLTRLTEVAQAAHVDVRESILSLKSGAGQAWTFRSALQQYLDAYRDQYSIHTELRLPDEYADGFFEPEIEMQLLRVIQEALTNARKHGGARCVQVVVRVLEHGAGLVISDDGSGFDPCLVEVEPGHYGLQFMRERAELIGGHLQVDSAPGKGTRVIVEVPGGLTQSRKER